MLRDTFGRLTVEITRDQLEAWAGRTLTDAQVAQLDQIIPDSSIPDAIGVITSEAMQLNDGWESE